MKNILEIIPLLIFFITYKKYGIITATLYLVISSIIAVALLAIKSRKIAKLPLFSALIIGFFGLLTWYFDDPVFIKVKPTIINFIFAGILLFGYFTQKPFLKFILEKSMQIKEEAWLILTFRWGMFFLVLGIANEIVWRNFSEAIWVNFKVFGLMGVSILFTMSQIPYMLRNQLSDSIKEDKK